MLRLLFLAVAAWAASFSVPCFAQGSAEMAADQTSGSTLEQSVPYRINAGDELQIYVWGEERLQRAVTVLPDGTFAFPLVGQIRAEGYLPADVEAAITNGLSDQYRGEVPQVTVSVASPAGLQFSVMGRVQNPGTFTPGRYVNILEALSMAGGPTEFANLDRILLIRKVGEELRTTQIRLAPLFKSGANENDIAGANILTIESGDTVIVP